MSHLDTANDTRPRPLYLVLPGWLDHLLLKDAEANSRNRHQELIAILIDHYDQRPADADRLTDRRGGR